MNQREQMQFPYPPQAIKESVDLEDIYLLGCDSFGSAVRVGIAQSNNVHTQNELADCLDIGYSHFNAMLNPKENKYFDPERIGEMESFLGNNAPSQYLRLNSKKKLYKYKKQELTTEQKAALWDQQQAV